MADYLHAEVLARLSRRQVSFLTRASVLDTLSGPLCDTVLDTRGSARRLAALERANLPLIPLDRRRRWYRYHPLFRELLRAELDHREPGLAPELHRRASAWFEADGLADGAVDHAQAAGDADGAARLVLRMAFPARAGEQGADQRRLRWFEDRGLVECYPAVAALGAVAYALRGEPAASERWASAAERPPPGGAGGVPPDRGADGGTIEGRLGLLRALRCSEGTAAMRRDARAAAEGLAAAGPWRPLALALEATSHLLDGAADRAGPLLDRAAGAAAYAGAGLAASVALAERALVAVEHHDGEAAESLAARALAAVEGGGAEVRAATALAQAALARACLLRDDAPRARDLVAQAAGTRAALTYAVPALAVQARLELARTHLGLADPAGARLALREARDILQVRPDLGTLPAQADELWAKLATARTGTTGAWSLTRAELRLLPLLRTHLSFRQIGERLYVSHHTVKTQAISVYRKLGVSSRSEAIARVHEVGLLGD